MKSWMFGEIIQGHSAAATVMLARLPEAMIWANYNISLT
jgi:hypothetical protein